MFCGSPSLAQTWRAGLVAQAVDAKDFANAFENASIGMAFVGTDSRRLRVNRAFCDMLGYSEEELLARSVWDITHPDDVGEDLIERDRCLRGEQSAYRREKRYLHRDGRIVWGLLACTLVRDDDGEPLHFLAQVQDITDRILAQQKLREAQALLHMAAQLGRLGAWSWEVGEARLDWSEEVCAIHEVKAGFRPTVGQALEFIAPHVRESMRATLRHCVRGGNSFDVEVPVVTAKGREIWTRVICEVEWDARGRVRRIRGACQDITETKNSADEARELLEQRVQERTLQLEVANRELQAFSYSIAHDLRAPLSSIDGFSRTLELGGSQLSPERALHCLARIRAGVRQMGELTDGLLALANLSRSEMLDEPVDLAVLARDALTACREASPQRTLEAHVAGSLPVRGDPRLLAQVIGNLVGNAWKFTGQREVAQIEVGECADAPGTYFVQDNGAGFDMAHATRMFEAFHRLHTQAEFQGTGIGLAIVQRIVTRHGGRIWAHSRPGHGATFQFTLAG